MDPKGDDSGSDTLDQTLQKKCVVADDDSSSKQPDAAVSEDNAAEEPTTEPGGTMSDPKDSPASPSPPPPPLPLPPPSSPSSQPTSTDNNSDDAAVLIVVKDKDLPDENTNSSGKDDSRGFESKVRQISDDLKDTTLADENSLEKVDAAPNENDDDSSKNEEAVSDATAVEEATAVTVKTEPDDAESSSETETATASGVTLEDIKQESDGYDSDRTITYESPSKKSSSSSSDKKKSKKITKKVRFKCNQGVKVLCSDDEGDDEAEGEEDDDDEDTLNEGGRSKNIRIPLSFASPHDEEDDILSDEESTQLSSDDTEPEDPPPEGGVQNILGKVSQMGKIEYLFRWVDKPGLQWESEEELNKMCPNLIKLYEESRAREREQDMHYVMRRKKIRQDLRDV